MAVTILFEKTQAKIDSVTLDASVSETHAAEVEVTDHPVEKGANISDHARPKARTLTIEGIVTNTPLAPDQAPESTTPTNIRANGRTVYDSRAPAYDGTRAGRAYRDLLALTEGKLITVVTGIESLENMQVTSISVPRDSKTGQALHFTIQLKQVVQVSNATAKLVEKKVKPKNDLGKKTGTATPEATRAKSFAKNIKDAHPIDKITGFVKGLFKP
jgi:hypothetical protein